MVFCNTYSVVSPMRIEFEKKLLELGLSYSVKNDNFYVISSQTGEGNHISVRLISSLPINKQVHGSKNGNDVLAIGLFKYKFKVSGIEPDILVFSFQSPVKRQPEFIIIPTHEFLRRHFKRNPGIIQGRRVEMVFWLMQDGSVFDTTSISVEAEWYFLSRGENGRISDGSEFDYSEYLNGWRRLIV
jgi:hypothetical protein